MSFKSGRNIICILHFDGNWPDEGKKHLSVIKLKIKLLVSINDFVFI